MARASIAVIGAGFSGVMTAIHLCRASPDLEVRLIERSPTFGQGAAYATGHPEHLLNVRAGNMSAFPGDPHHFVDWLKARAIGDGSAFVSRACYGEYLQSLLREALQGGQLSLEVDEAVDAVPDGEGWRLELALGRRLYVDGLVLAIGNLPPQTPPGLGLERPPARRYVADPWRAAEALEAARGPVVLMGTGLTMIDVALSLPNRREVSLLAVSRRGLLPLRHTAVTLGPAAEAPPGPPLSTMLGSLRAAASVGDWRPVVDGLRPHVQTIWQGWSDQERGRFLRHARPYWDIHRHRLSPAVASRLDHLMGSGRLRVAAGRFEGVTETADGLEIVWRPRGETKPRREQAALLVNCLGPNGDLTRAHDTLLSRLVVRGLIRPDRQRLGAEVDAQSRPIGEHGAHPTLFAVGPMTRGAFWEITAVPDIRVQAEHCAQALAASLRR